MTRRLAVEALALRAPLTGVGNYTADLLRALLHGDEGLALDLLHLGAEPLDLRPLAAYADRVVTHVRERIPPNAYRLAVAAGIAPTVERLFPVVRQASALLYPNFVRYPSRLTIPEVVVVYDATFRDFPEDKSPAFNRVWGRLTQQALSSRATAVSISESAAADIGRHFRLREPLGVLYPGPEHARGELERGEHVLVVGTSSPRKNVDVVLRAWARADPPDTSELVVVGSGHTAYPGVRVTGFVDDAELRQLTRSARAVVAPSRGEGFDLPVLEATRAGVPVVASDIAVHREVLGDDWPWLFAPDDDARLADLLAGITSRDCPPPVPDEGRFDWARSATLASGLLGLT